MNNLPYQIESYDPVDLKLGIKSSLPKAKATIALAILFWEAVCPASIARYCDEDQSDQILKIDPFLKNKLINFIKPHLIRNNVSEATFLEKVALNNLFTSQIESLKVAFELVWPLAEVTFLDKTKPFASERTGKIRFPKQLIFTSNIDLIHALISDCNAYFDVLLNWMGLSVIFDKKYENNLCLVLTILSENAIFKLSSEEQNVVFNENGIYKKLVDTKHPVNITGSDEPKGSLRILRRLLSESINPFIKIEGQEATFSCDVNTLMYYSQRVSTFHKLTNIDLKTISGQPTDCHSPLNFEDKKSFAHCGVNVILYGVPGSGKSYTIDHEYIENSGADSERIVFHPDYTYSDFVGQIRPIVKNGEARYDFVPGPFTTILRRAFQNPTKKYFLVIEEINRGNSAAIFGDVFQLLDREHDPNKDNYQWSKYSIYNENIAMAVFENPSQKILIPSNLGILATMNTSDQNVFTLDTAFQRRWDLRQILNVFDKSERESKELAEQKILDTDVSWEAFLKGINKAIIDNNIGLTSVEDKRLGTHFLLKEDLIFENLNEQGISKEEEVSRRLHNQKFAEKVIKYLWDDAFKFNRQSLFKPEYKDLETVIHDFAKFQSNDRFKIFSEDIIDSIEEISDHYAELTGADDVKD